MTSDAYALALALELAAELASAFAFVAARLRNIRFNPRSLPLSLPLRRTASVRRRFPVPKPESVVGRRLGTSSNGQIDRRFSLSTRGSPPSSPCLAISAPEKFLVVGEIASKFTEATDSHRPRVPACVRVCASSFPTVIRGGHAAISGRAAASSSSSSPPNPFGPEPSRRVHRRRKHRHALVIQRHEYRNHGKSCVAANRTAVPSVRLVPISRRDMSGKVNEEETGRRFIDRTNLFFLISEREAASCEECVASSGV